MLLTFQKSIGFLEPFDPVELPDFSLVTGLNGSGKTQFLMAINRGDISVDFTGERMLPAESVYLNASSIYALSHTSDIGHWKREQYFTAIQHIHKDDQDLEYAFAVSNKARPVESEEDNKLRVSEIIDKIQKNRVDNFFTLDSRLQDILKNMASINNIGFYDLNHSHYKEHLFPYWGGNNFFHSGILEAFDNYSRMLRENDDIEVERYRQQIQSVRLGESPPDISPYFLSDIMFRKINGPPPWETLNSAIEKVGLRYVFKFDPIPGMPAERPVRLFNSVNNKEVNIQDLSSGEKVIMAFAFVINAAEDSRHNKKNPKLVLFDEIDSVLHPSMASKVYEIIASILIKGYGMKVVATTHSPVTIAVAKPDKIYQMQVGGSGLTEISQETALNILTQDVPRLAISHQGLRQVFVESEYDAELYAQLYSSMEGYIQSERTLQFIGTGIKKDDSDIHTGCGVVKSLVETLTKSGNKSVFGIVDWDTTNKPKGRFRVLAYERRYSLENVMFDPLLVAAMIFRDFPSHIEGLGFSKKNSFSEMRNFAKEDLQRAVNAVTFGVFKTSPTGTTSVVYQGGLALEVDERWCVCKGHTLAHHLLQSFKFGRISQYKEGQPNITLAAHKLMRHISSVILKEEPKFAPSEITAIFAEILDYTSH